MHVIVYVTTSDIEEAGKIGEIIVRERLAACANILDNIMSIYWWKGKIEKDNEALLLLKTRNEMVEKIISRIKELHSYEVPDITFIPLEHGSEDYLNWIDENIRINP